MISKAFDTSSHDEFIDYYGKQSDKQETWNHFERVYQGLVALREDAGKAKGLRIGDIGGGAGTLSRVLASHGQKPVCIDLNKALIEIGSKRAEEAGMDIEFHVASATAIPLKDESLDLCIVSELLEHIEDWEKCIDETSRVLKPGGLIYLSTTNVMCPKQDEFNLPLYSWFPPPLKRYVVQRALTDRPDLANYATYPAYHWFSFYSLQAALAKRGFTAFFDNFDLSVAREAQGIKGMIYNFIRSTPITRFLAYFTSNGTTIIAFKGTESMKA